MVLSKEHIYIIKAPILSGALVFLEVKKHALEKVLNTYLH